MQQFFIYLGLVILQKKSLDEFAKKFPHIIGGSADLDGSNCTTNFANSYDDFSSSNPKGRNIAFGVREFPMGAITVSYTHLTLPTILRV